MKSILIAAAAALAISGGALAQDKGKMDKGAKGGAPQVQIKVLHENDKLRVTETTYVPGAESNAARSNMRVVRALQGGTLQRNWPDGKKEDIAWKTGDVRVNNPSGPYMTKNIGKSTIKLYTVTLK